MDLTLSVPETTATTPAETDSQAIQRLLAALPFGKPGMAAAGLLPPLQALNRRTLPGDSRFQLMELYRPGVFKVVQGLAAHYTQATLPPPENARKAALLASALLTELAYGYKLALLGRSTSLFGANKLLPQMVQRALDALSQQLVVSYQVYGPAPKTVWSELHQLYGFAARQKMLEAEIPAQAQEPATRISLTYKQALLLYLADPRHLSAADIQRVRDYLGHYADLAEIRPWGEVQDQGQGTAGMFLVRPQADDPPAAFARSKASGDTQADLLLVTSALTARLAHQRERLEARDAPGSLGLPPAALDSRYQDLLAHLHKFWEQAPKRVFSRAQRQDEAWLCSGLPDVHFYLNGEQRYPVPDTARQDVTEITLGAAPAASKAAVMEEPASSRWRILNESAGGAALALLPGESGRLRLGELIAIRTGQGGQWWLGAVRWASAEQEGTLNIGAQMIAPQARPVAVRIAEGGHFRPALLLPEIVALKQPATLVMEPDCYHPARAMELDERGSRRRLMTTRLVERNACFERFQFSWL